MMSKEYADRVFEPITWEMRRERIPNDYEVTYGGALCWRCGNEANQFNHTDTNCEKYKKSGWKTPEEQEKLEDAKNDLIK